MRQLRYGYVAVLVISALVGGTTATCCAKPQAAVVCPAEPTAQESLAAREIRRYVYLRTGELLPIVQKAEGDAIIVARQDRPIVEPFSLGELGPQQYVLKTFLQGDRRVLLVVGGDGPGMLYGAYRLAEHLGVRFFLHGDVIPDKQILLVLPFLEETGKPLFELRGLNPWGSHPFGFDLWNTDDYKSHIGQMAKMRMNFIGMHCYPEGHPYAEPTVWVGVEGDFDPQGRVKFSYPSVYYNALFSTRWGGLRPAPTSQYHLGAAAMFDRDGWGPEVLRGHAPRPTVPESCNEVFNRTGTMFDEAFGFARLVGVKTCLGTEAPMIMPKALQERLKSQGKDPADPAVVQQVYEGTFRRIAAAHPLDYYWLWTPEGWTWGGNTAKQMKVTMDDVKIARAALKEADAPFQLATSGWVLGPADDRSGFDEVLPKEIALSAISRHLGEDPVDPAFKQIQRRGKWAIPWMEGDNGGLAVPQLWVGRTRQDATDALDYGCTGLMGLVWRTRILGPNIATLARAGWEQPWNDRTTKHAQVAEPAAKPAEGARGGKAANYPGAAVDCTEDDLLYQTCRYDTRGYDLDVPNGTYRVTLQFCEPHFDSAGKRVWDVKIQGKKVVERLDIFAVVGKFAALDRAFDDVQVADERLKIEFAYLASLPCISGIVIEGKTFTRKINCGGPALQDYAADVAPPQSAAPASRMRKVPCGDFYADWATALFGEAPADDVAGIFSTVDSRLPRPLSQGCPAGVRPNGQPWEQVAGAYAFVDELARCRTKVTGAGNLDRFDYWLGTMEYLRAGAKLDCAVGKFLAVMKKVNAETDPAARKQLAAELGTEAYREILDAYREAFGHLLATVSTNGGLATVMYWEHGFYPQAVGNPGGTLAAALGTPLPDELTLSPHYSGPTRLIVPTVRTSVAVGEQLNLNAVVLSSQRPQAVTLHWREMGRGEFRRIPFTHVARGVYAVRFPPATADVEYYIEATLPDGPTKRFPATAPNMNQTLVLLTKPRPLVAPRQQ
ncbi:MAG: hypothetical protein HQ567_23800 [Candidatus Nealsonbacteria bacterium]|nr:hypothetical protein [Candidatus Nealsonbacteria bacterium]